MRARQATERRALPRTPGAARFMKKMGFIAIACAAISVGLGHLYLQRLEVEVSGGPKIAVLAVVKDVPVGESLSEASVAVRDVPLAYVEGRHVRASDLDQILGSRITGGLRSGELVLWSDLAAFSDQARLLSGLVQQGMRAVPLDVPTADFGGLLRPGDRVDVLLSTGRPVDGAGETRTLLQNLLVLSVGGSFARTEEVRSGRTGTVTVSATVEQAQLLVQARARGRLSLTLRNPEDVAVVEELPSATDKNLTEAMQRESTRAVAASNKGKIEHVR